MNIDTMKRIALVLCVLLMGACAKDIVKLTGDIKGMVKDYDNSRLIENCEVTITPGGYTTITNSNGAWEYTNLEPGEYTLTFRKAGYNDESRKISIVSGQTANLDILMRAKSPFDISESYYDFGDYTSEHTFICYNNSNGVSDYEIYNFPEWITSNKKSGSISSGSSDTFRLSVDRNKLSEGEHRRTLSIKYSGNNDGEITLEIVVKKVKLTTPTVSISASATEIDKESFKIEGKIEAMGGAQITEHGFYWGISQSEMTQHEDLGSLREAGAFYYTITGLDYNTTYYVKAYARNSQGVAYSKVISVTTQDLASNIWDGSTASSFAGGKGTSASPYLIETGAQLVLMKKYSDKCFKLKQNINLNNRAWPSFDFSGTLDGNGYIISNLKITKSGDNIGFFAKLNGTVKNLTISGVDIDSSGDNVGALAGHFEWGTVTNCHIKLNKSSYILGNQYVGGMFGTIASGYEDNGYILNNCSVAGVSTDTQISGVMAVGGLIGRLYESNDINNCSVAANIYGTQQTGGIIGLVEDGWGLDNVYLSQCSYSGELSAQMGVGGIVGDFNNGDFCITGCKAEVKINVEEDAAGGILGTQGATIIGSYASGEIICGNSNAKYLGGLAAATQYNWGGIYHSYSAVVSTNSAFNGLVGEAEYGGSSKIEDCVSIAKDNNNPSYFTNCTLSATNVTSAMQNCYSDYADYWNYNKTWTWTGKVNGQSRSISCPRLAWE